METSNKQYAKIFKALCDEQRLNILDLLRNEEKCACNLLENLDIVQSSLSYHMKILVDSGIVESRQDGKWTHYKICEDGSREAIRVLTKITASDYAGKEACSIGKCCK